MTNTTSGARMAIRRVQRLNIRWAMGGMWKGVYCR
jgi:hypothetical protein